VIFAAACPIRIGAQISTPPPAGARASWREGQRAYYDEPLSAVIADLNRYSPDRIELTDPALNDLQYTGTVFPEDLGDRLDVAAWSGSRSSAATRSHLVDRAQQCPSEIFWCHDSVTVRNLSIIRCRERRGFNA
jgi:hypothetical protein